MGEVSDITDTLKVQWENVDSFSEYLFAEAVKLGEKVDVEPSIPRLCGRQTKRANTPAASPEEIPMDTSYTICGPLQSTVGRAFQRTEQKRDNGSSTCTTSE